MRCPFSHGSRHLISVRRNRIVSTIRFWPKSHHQSRTRSKALAFSEAKRHCLFPRGRTIINRAMSYPPGLRRLTVFTLEKRMRRRENATRGSRPDAAKRRAFPAFCRPWHRTMRRPFPIASPPGRIQNAPLRSSASIGDLLASRFRSLRAASANRGIRASDPLRIASPQAGFRGLPGAGAWMIDGIIQSIQRLSFCEKGRANNGLAFSRRPAIGGLP